MQEESLEQENSIKHRVTKTDINNSLKEYLGKYALVFKEFTTKDYELFQRVLPKVEKTAYLVKGSQEILRKFKAYFIIKCVMDRYEYSSFMLKDYIEGLSTRNDNELFLAGVSKELLFLYLHHESSGTGGTENWIATATLDRMVNRKREGLITVLLSERTFPIIEKSKEVTVISLGGAKRVADTKAAIDDINQNKAGEKETEEPSKTYKACY